MKKTKSTVFVISMILLVLTLIVLEGNAQADSQSSEFRMISDVICGIGGGAQSASFALKASAGAQGSPVGPQSSENYSVSGGWVYTTGPQGLCGDVNGDEIVNVGDVVYLVSYLYKGGPPPDPLWVGDVNSDDITNVGDVVYLISYLYKGGPLPCEPPSGCGMFASASRLNGSSGRARISLSLKNDPAKENGLGLAKASRGDLDEVMEISVTGKFDRIVAGAELEIEFDSDQVRLLDPQLTPLTDGLQLFTGTKDGVQKIGIVDLSGKNHLPAGEGALVTLRAKGNDLASVKIKKATLVDLDARPLALELSGELNLEVAKDSDSRPQSFSLSQNYPNPFNPETEISYALPNACPVKLFVYNLLGQRVRTLVDEYQAAGHKSVLWDGTDEDGKQVASGVYFYRIEAGEFTDARKMILMK
jgi:hypothetical protein